MGVEAFGVSMQIAGPDVFERIKQTLQNYEHVAIYSMETQGCFQTVNGEYSDAFHFIDLQIAREIHSEKCTFAIRFSLCSHKSIDDIFIAIITRALDSFEAESWLMTSAIGQKTHFLPSDLRWFLAALPDEISEMRRHWQNKFGTKQGRVRVKDSFAFVGVVA